MTGIDGGVGVDLGVRTMMATGVELLGARGLGPVDLAMVLAGETRSTGRGGASCMIMSLLVAPSLSASGLGGSALSLSSNWMTSGRDTHGLMYQ